jgi:hypothetical protein
MENTSTRISDLPDANSIQQQSGPPPAISVSKSAYDSNSAPMNNTYSPLNAHPNPYGISAQNPIMPNPQQSQQPVQLQQQVQQAQYISEEQKLMLQQQSYQRLPSRDIPRDTAGYAQDEEVKPNYIPKANVSSDYVREYEDMTERNLREYEDKKRKENRLDAILTEIQTPLFIAVLFLIFQLPVINTFLFKRFSFLSIYKEDGNFNFNGLIFKSLLFGSAFYTLSKVTTYLSEI